MASPLFIRDDENDYEREYDTDSLSITSTVESTWAEEALYDVESIISEKTTADDEGNQVTTYLTKWVGYPLHKCTWEPVKHLADTTLLADWDSKWEQLGEVAITKLIQETRAEFEAAEKNVAAAKALRKQKRAKKREKLKSAGKGLSKDVKSDIDSGSGSESDVPLRRKKTARPVISLSDSESDTPLMVKRADARQEMFASQKSVQSIPSHPEGQTSPPRRSRSPAPELPSSSPSSSDSETSTDSLFEQPRTETSDAQHRNAPHKPIYRIGRSDRTRGRTASSRVSKNPAHGSTISSARPQPDESKHTKHDKCVEPDAGGPGRPHQFPDQPIRRGSGQSSRQAGTIANATSTAPMAQRGSKVTEGMIAQLAGPSEVEGVAQMSKPMQSMRKSAPNPGPIKMVNKPKTVLRSPWHKQGDLSQYSKMHYRRKAELRVRDEQTPDPDALSFVNGPSGGTSRISAQEKDNLYGRRDIVALRPTRDSDSDNDPVPDPTKLTDWENEKVPLTCYDWRNGSCYYSPEQCKFLHRNTDKISPWDGWVPPKYARPKVTCPHWMKNLSGCRKTDDECLFAHWNTGWIVNQGLPPKQIDSKLEPASIQQSKSLPQHQQSSLPRLKSMGEDEKSALTCFFWLRSPMGCEKAAGKCAFAHSNTGWLAKPRGPPIIIDPAEQPVDGGLRVISDAPVPLRSSGDGNSNTRVPPRLKTCYFWHRDGKCNKGDSCMFAHYDTGIPPIPPPSVRKLSSTNATSLYESYHNSQICASNFDLPPSPDAGPLPDEAYAGLSNWTAPTSHEASIIPDSEPASASLSCMIFKQMAEHSCSLDFADMFGDDKENITLDRRAFLIFHPGDHAKECELITRWLLLHYVEVCSFWFEGAWEYFKLKIINGGSGVIIAHPDYTSYSEIPDFGQVLRQKVRIWSVGLQYGIEYDPDTSTTKPSFRYDRIEIFPRGSGGIIYITDNVFNERPAAALKIIEMFFAKVERCRQVNGPIDPTKFVDDGCVVWRLATQPGLMESIWKQCIVHEKDIDAQDPIQSTRAKLYKLLLCTGYVEQDFGPLSARPEDYFPIMSERPEIIPEYYEALRRNQDEANTWMVQMYAGLAIDRRRQYRQYYVVHTEPSKAGWKSTCQNISEIITPDECIRYFEQPAEGNTFDFHEWAFPEKTPANPA